MRSTVIVAAFCAFIAAAVHSAENPMEKIKWETTKDRMREFKNELECYSRAAGQSHFMCALAMQVAIIDKDLGPAAKCIDGAKTNAEAHYKLAARRLAKNKSGVSMLKDTHAFYLTNMDALLPEPGETKFLYERRTGDAARKLKEMLNRLQLER